MPTATPQRPPFVPAAAVWSELEYEWRLNQTDDLGRLHGPFRSWRTDGSPREISAYQHGKQSGPAWKFHPDGSLYSLGCFAEGAERGVHRRYANDEPNGEPLQVCCVPRGAWQLRLSYVGSAGVDRGWFTRDGIRLLDSGEPYPERPAAVPAEAWFNEGLRSWEAGVVFEGEGFTGRRRLWAPDGVLRLVEDLKRGKRHGRVQSFADNGPLEWEAHYADGRLSGSFWAPILPAGHFADARICAQSGWFDGDHATGPWRYFDAAGTVISERDLGLALDDRTMSQSAALANTRRPATWWRALAKNMFAERRVGEALIAAARASAQSSDPKDIANAISAWTQPQGGEAAISSARQAMEQDGENAVALIEALKGGSDASTLLWALSKALSDADYAALDLVSAAVLLAPSSTERYATRALLYGALGDLESARADVARVSETSPEQGEFLELYLRVYFPRFAFWPQQESFQVVDGESGGGLRVDRTVTEVRDTIKRYATRLGCLRAGLLARLSDAANGDHVDGDTGHPTRTGHAGNLPFMIPDLSALLPDGPVPLSRWTFQMSADEYQGLETGAQGDDRDGQQSDRAVEGNRGRNVEQPDGEGAEDNREANLQASVPDDGETPATVDLNVDELRNIDPIPNGILRILRWARADWSGLVWLCWAVGLEAPGLPEAIRPPAAFTRAAVMTIERSWRCRDKLQTSGLLAMTKGIPGFDWEGRPIDLVPSALADVALDEYVEARAVFSWLCDGANRSLWQDDLRGAEA